MRPRYWVDFHLSSSAKTGSRNAGLAVPALAAQALQVLHGVFVKHPAQYALAMPATGPHMSVLRVFADDRESLDTLVHAIDQHHVFRDYVHIGYPRAVPTDFKGEWVEYRRYRIPTRKSDRHEGAPLRRRRIEEADKMQLPYFQLRSKGTGQTFSLIVERRKAPGQDASSSFVPDGYGLSRASSPVPLPDFPVRT